jgi:predicted RNase H-like nuclease (RuvC/YqgF family)
MEEQKSGSGKESDIGKEDLEEIKQSIEGKKAELKQLKENVTRESWSDRANAAMTSYRIQALEKEITQDEEIYDRILRGFHTHQKGSGK